MKNSKDSKKLKIVKEIFDLIMVAFGCLIMAFAFSSFCIPNKIAPGGLSGLATVIHYMIGLPVGVLTFILCVPFILIQLKDMGLSFVIKTLYGTIMFSLFVDIFAKVPTFTHDIFLASIFGGIILGIGLGIVFKFRGTTGGTDLIAVIVQKKFPTISIGMCLLFIDFLVVLIAGIAFRNLEIMLYSAITLFTCTKALDFIQDGVNYTKAFYIFTTAPNELKNAIYENVNRGVTFIKATGGYSGEDKEILLCVVTRTQVTLLKDLTREIDPKAFIMLADVHEVLGEGFNNIKK